MVKNPPKVRFKAKLLRPDVPGRRVTWMFLVLPKAASAKLPTRGMTMVEGTINDHPFQAALEPDGLGSHWLKVPRTLRESAAAKPGDVVVLAIKPVDKEPEPRVPTDLRKALTDADAEARAVWADITAKARRDWIYWITSAKRPETRVRRIHNACGMLASGKRRVCCFDRSGMYGKNLGAPKAVDESTAQ